MAAPPWMWRRLWFLLHESVIQIACVAVMEAGWGFLGFIERIVC